MNTLFPAVMGFAAGVLTMQLLSEPSLAVREQIPACPAGATGQQMLADGRIFCSYIQGRGTARVVWEELK
jgi:hypothetical protein